MEKKTIYIVDDHQMLIDGLKALLKGEKLFEIVGACTNPEKSIAEIIQLSPHILLTDINMPQMSGVELAKKVKEHLPEIKILALSMFGDRQMISDMLNVGASGYILKNTGKKELIDALVKIANGGMFFSDEVSTVMMKAYTNQHAKKENEISLTVRENEIVKLINDELSNLQIAEKLFISERTVETHRKNIFRKTETKSVIGLLKWAMEKRIL